MPKRKLIFHGGSSAFATTWIFVAAVVVVALVLPRRWVEWFMSLNPWIGILVLGGLSLLVTPFLRGKLAAQCPGCHEQTFATVSSESDVDVRHECSQCGLVYVNGEPAESLVD